MGSPKPPKPDPAIAAAQAAEQRRAEADQTLQTQAGLNADNVSLRRRFGTMGTGMGSAPAGVLTSGGGSSGDLWSTIFGYAQSVANGGPRSFGTGSLVSSGSSASGTSGGGGSGGFGGGGRVNLQ